MGSSIATWTTIETLKKPNAFRKYNAVLRRFAKHFVGRTLDAVSVEDLNDFIVTLKKGGMSPNTVLHNVIIIAQFCKRNGRSGITRQVHLPERISSLPPRVHSGGAGQVSGRLR